MTETNTTLPVFALVDGIDTLSKIVSRATLADIHRDRTFDIISQQVLRQNSGLRYSAQLQAYADNFKLWHLSLLQEKQTAPEMAPQLWLEFKPASKGGDIGFKVTRNGELPGGIVIPLSNLCEKVQSPYSGNELIDDYAESLDKLQRSHPEKVDHEMALLALLVHERNNPSVGLFDFTQTGADEIFHKQFRQVDVCERPGVDRAIWHLLCACPIFWGVFKNRAPLLFWPTK